ncbi:MAG TPA: COX15/CtaA family protein [Acidobacteriota bacterium]|jgi:cytochrome c oxidase assembly protein subunit 15
MPSRLNPQSEIRNPKSNNPQSEIRNPKSLHRFACFTAVCTFFLIIAGGLVTSNDAGLAVPDWPLSFGKWLPEMPGGVLYEHSHRMVAAFVGMLTVILAVWISVKEPRRWVRRLGWTAMATVILQGLLGGITVLYFLPPAVSMAHASLAQAFFCLTISTAVVTGDKWAGQQSETDPEDRPSLRGISLCLVAAVYAQLILGAGYRHNALGIGSHILGAAVVVLLAARLAVITVRFYPGELNRHSLFLLGLVVGQALLGTATFFIKKENLRAPQPIFEYVWSSTAHVALGALILASALLLALRIHRRYPGANIGRKWTRMMEIGDHGNWEQTT